MDPALDDGIKGKKDRPEIQDILRNRIKYKQILRQKIIAGDLVPFMHQATLRIDRCNGNQELLFLHGLIKKNLNNGYITLL